MYGIGIQSANNRFCQYSYTVLVLIAVLMRPKKMYSTYSSQAKYMYGIGFAQNRSIPEHKSFIYLLVFILVVVVLMM